MSNQLAVEVPTIPVNRQLLQVLVVWRAATEACDLIHGTLLVHRETLFDNLPAPIDSASTPYRGMVHSWNPNATFGDPVRLSTERPVARSEEQIGDTTPTSRFARRPSTRKSLFPAEGVYPQNYMVDQQRLLISELHFDKFPTPSTVLMLEDKMQNPSNCLFWFSLGGDVMDQRSGDGRFSGRSNIIALNSMVFSFPQTFEMLDARIACALNKINQNSQFKKKVSLEEQKQCKLESRLQSCFFFFC